MWEGVSGDDMSTLIGEGCLWVEGCESASGDDVSLVRGEGCGRV